jgi:hypothetical protein
MCQISASELGELCMSTLLVDRTHMAACSVRSPLNGLTSFVCRAVVGMGKKKGPNAQ